jgi:amino acid permease
MSALATIRPDDWNLPLFLHILGGFAMVGALVLAVTYLVPAWRSGSLDSLRLGYRALLWGALPAFIVMRVGAEWLYSEEKIGDLPEEPAWTGLGYAISDIGLLLFVIATVTAGVGARRARLAAEAGGAADARGGRVATILVGVILVAYVVAIWAMTTKPI